MKRIFLLLATLTIVVSSCKSKYPNLDNGVYAEFVTNKGTFVAKLYHEATPLTAANFIELAEGTHPMVDTAYAGKPYYNGIIFHRVIKDFMIQGGDPLGTGSGSPGYRFPDEFVDSLKHDRKGLLSMANSGPATNGSQFFVTLKETPWLNNKHTIFGEVVMGQEVVDSIGIVETTKPGDKPVDEIIMQEVNIIKKGNIKLPSFTAEMEVVEEKKREKEARLAKVAQDKLDEFNKQKVEAQEYPSGLKVYWSERGTGTAPKEGDMIRLDYAGYFDDGRLFDTSMLKVAEAYENVNEQRKAANQYLPINTPFSKDARLIPGFREAMLSMKPGDKITAFIPSHLGYGAVDYGPIPANSDLVFELALIDVVE